MTRFCDICEKQLELKDPKFSASILMKEIMGGFGEPLVLCSECEKLSIREIDQRLSIKSGKV